MPNLLKPNIVTIERRTDGGTSPTGESLRAAPTLIGAGYPALIDTEIASSTNAGRMEFSVEGQTVHSTHVLFLDGVPASAIPPGVAPGATFTFNDLAYRLTMNARAALPDLRIGDRVTDEEGNQYQCCSVDKYTDVAPNIQARIAFGQGWTDGD